jgi:hypothetical protein
MICFLICQCLGAKNGMIGLHKLDLIIYSNSWKVSVLGDFYLKLSYLPLEHPYYVRVYVYSLVTEH